MHARAMRNQINALVAAQGLDPRHTGAQECSPCFCSDSEMPSRMLHTLAVCAESPASTASSA